MFVVHAMMDLISSHRSPRIIFFASSLTELASPEEGVTNEMSRALKPCKEYKIRYIQMNAIMRNCAFTWKESHFNGI